MTVMSNVEPASLVDVFSEKISQILRDQCDSESRVNTIDRVLQHPSFSRDLCGVVLPLLLAETTHGEHAWTTLSECLRLPLVATYLVDNLPTVKTILAQSVSRNSPVQMCWEMFKITALLDLAEFVCAELSRRTTNGTTRDVLSDVALQLLARIDTCVRVQLDGDVRKAFIDRLLVPFLQLTRQRTESTVYLLSHELRTRLRSLVNFMLLNFDSIGDDFLVLCVKGNSHSLPANIQSFLQLVASLLSTRSSESEQLLDILLSELLCRCVECPLPVLVFWTEWLQLFPQQLLKSAVPSCKWSSSCVLSVDTRLRLFCCILRALSSCRPNMSSAWRQLTVLQWLRSCCSALLEMRDSDDAVPSLCSSQWFECACALLSVSPLSIHLNTQLGPVLLTALQATARKETVADFFMEQLFITYGSLNQLPKLIPKLVLACRQSHASRYFLLSGRPQRVLAGVISHAPQPHILSVLRSLVFHLESDVHEPLTTDVSAKIDRVDGAVISEPGVVQIALQMSSLFLDHCALIDENKLTPACCTQLPAILDSVCRLLRSISRLLVSSERQHPHSPLVELVVDSCVSWRRLQTTLLHYCRPYRDAVTKLGDSGKCLINALAPLSLKRRDQLAALLRSDCAAVNSRQLCDLQLWFQLPCNQLYSLPVNERLGRFLEYGDVSLTELLARFSSASRSQISSAVVANGECRRLHVAIIAQLTAQLSAGPLSGKRPRQCESSVRRIVKRLRSVSEHLYLICSPHLLDNHSSISSVEQLRDEIQLCLKHTGQLLLQAEVSPTNHARAEYQLETVLHVLSLLPLEFLSTACAAVCVCLLLLIIMIRAAPDKSPAQDGHSAMENSASSPVALLLRVLTSIHEPWPILAIDVDNLVMFLQRTSNEATRRPIMGAILDAGFTGVHTVQLSSVVELMCNSRSADETWLNDVIPLVLHLLEQSTAHRQKSIEKLLKKIALAAVESVVAIVDTQTSHPTALFEICCLLLPVKRARRNLAAVLPGLCDIAMNLLQDRESTSDERRRRIWNFCAAVCRLAESAGSALVRSLWKIVLRDQSVCCEHVQAVLLAMSGSQLQRSLDSLTSKTRTLTLHQDDAAIWSHRLLLWCSVSTCLLDKSVRPLQREALNWLGTWLTHLVARHTVWSASSSCLLKVIFHLFCELLSQRCVRLSDVVYGAVLVACCPLINDFPVADASEILVTIGNIAFHLASLHTALATARVPHLARVVVYLAQSVCRLSSTTTTGSNDANKPPVSTNTTACATPSVAARQINRLVRAILALGTDSQAMIPCVMADVLPLIQTANLCPYVQRAIETCIIQMMDACRDEVLTRLRIVLPSSVHQLFDDTLITYKRLHKFTGRV